jgi:hypothetical protein
MTEAALDSGGAPAPAETTGAPLPEVAVDVPNALGSQTPVAEQPDAKPEAPKTAGEAVRKAMETVKAKEAAKAAEADNGAKPAEPKDPAAKADAKAEVKDTKQPEVKPEAKPAERAADGKFAPKVVDGQAEPVAAATQQPPAATEQAKTKFEAPARFDEVAKRDWETAPDSVKGATSRVIRELETGIQEHQKRWEPIKQYDDLAKQYQTDLPSALERYVSMDKLLSQDLATGLDSVIRDKTGGQMGLREFVAQLTGQKPDEATAQTDRTTHELRQQVASLEKHLGAVVGHIRQQAATSIEDQVSSFAADKPDFDALSDKVAEHIGKGLGLEAAYQAAKQDAEAIARSLGFVPATEVSQPLSPAPSPAPLKPAGQKSVSGAPATGSDPASQKKAPASSIREALERAKARVA